MDLQGLLQILDKYGVGGLITVLIALIIITGIKADWFKKITNKISDKFLEKFMKDLNQ